MIKNVYLYFTCRLLFVLCFILGLQSCRQSTSSIQNSAGFPIGDQQVLNNNNSAQDSFNENNNQNNLNLILTGNNQNAPNGPRTGGGGDSCALAVTQIQKVLMKVLPNLNLLNELEIKQLKSKLESTQYFVSQADGDIVFGKEKRQAVNFPETNKIIFSKNFCKSELLEVTNKSMSLLFHEYLGLIEKNDKTYSISGSFFEKMSQQTLAKAVLKERIMNEIKKDMKKQKSCFDNAVYEKSKDLSEGYGAHFIPENLPEIDIIETSSVNYRDFGKNIIEGYNKDWSKAPDKDEADIIRWGHSSSHTYAVAIKYNFATSGSIESASILFSVENEQYQEKFTDFNLNEIKAPETFIHKLVTKNTINCKLLKSDMKD